MSAHPSYTAGKTWGQFPEEIDEEQEAKRIAEVRLLQALTRTEGIDINTYYRQANIKPRINIQEIEEALKPSTVSNRTPYQVKNDKRTCPVCQRFENWNLQILKEHIEDHLAYKEYKRWGWDTELEYKKLLNKRSLKQKELTGVLQEQAALNTEIERFENSADCGQLAKDLRQKWIAAILSGQDIEDDIFYGDLHFGDKAVTTLEQDYIDRRHAQSHDDRAKGLNELLNEEGTKRMISPPTTSTAAPDNDSKKTYTYKHSSDEKK
jgi:hypothetical protein